MKYGVSLTDKAEEDVAKALAWFVDQDARPAGRRWMMELLRRLKILETRAESCLQAVDAEIDGYVIPELLLGTGRHRHRLLFRIRDEIVEVLRIWHSSRTTPSERDLAD